MTQQPVKVSKRFWLCVVA